MTTEDAPLDWNQIGEKFIALVIKSPIAIVTMVLSFFLGYGISFLLFDYRNNSAKSSHYLFHLLIGLGYMAVVFIAVNWNVVSREMSEEDFSKCMPLTLLVSFAVAFPLMIGISIYKELKKPYA